MNESWADGQPPVEAEAPVATSLNPVVHSANSVVAKESALPDVGSEKSALFLDAQGNIVAAQPRCASFFGRQPEELSGLNVQTLLKPGFDREVAKLLAEGEQSDGRAFHVFALRSDGSEFTT